MSVCVHKGIEGFVGVGGSAVVVGVADFQFCILIGCGLMVVVDVFVVVSEVVGVTTVLISVDVLAVAVVGAAEAGAVEAECDVRVIELLP